MAKRPLRLSTPSEARKALTTIVNEVRSGSLTPAQANAMVCAINALLGSIRLDEQGKKLEQLETILQEHESSERP